MAQEYSMDDVKAHKTAKDCWLVVHGKVYDVTKFLGEHPGGEEILLETAGQDASEAFDDIGHSLDAKKQLETFLVGSVAGYVAPVKTGAAGASEAKGKDGCILQ